jgi:hypothetical protein
LDEIKMLGVFCVRVSTKQQISKGVLTMANVQVTVSRKDVKVSKTYDFGDTLAEMVAKYGDRVVASNAIIGMKTALRNKMSAVLNAQDKDENFINGEAEVLAAVANWVPQEAGTRAAGTSKLESLAALLKAMSPEERAAFLAGL